MKRFILGFIVGVVVCHYAEERKKKMLADDLKATGDAVAKAAGSSVDVVSSAMANATGASPTSEEAAS